MLKVKKMKNRWKKIIIAIFTLVGSCLIFPIFITSCSHISTEYESNGYTTVADNEKTVIYLPSSQSVQFTKEYFWENLNYFKQLVVSNNVFSNTEILPEEISIPYSSISALDSGSKKAFTCKIYLQKYYYNGRLIELNNTSFGLGSNEYIATIPSEIFNEFISYDLNSSETIKFFQEYIIQHLDDYFSSFPPDVSNEDLIINDISAIEGGSKLSISFELRAIYNNNGEKSRRFTISYVPQTNNKSFSVSKLSSTKLNNSTVSSNVNSTKIQFII